MLVAYSWTPFTESIGGIETLLNAFMRYASDHWPGRIDVKALSGTGEGFLAGSPGENVAIEPICSRKSWLVPVNLKFTLSLWRRKPRCGNSDVLYLHRTDHALPFLSEDGPPLVLYIHGGADCLDQPNESQLRFVRAAVPLIEDAAIRRAQKVFICSERGRQFYAQRYPRYACRFEVLPSAVDDTTFRLTGISEARRALGIDELAFLVLFVGRIEEVKNPLLWASAFHQVCLRMPSARGAILGTGALQNKMLRTLEGYGIRDRILRCGSASEAGLVEWYNAANALLLTSHFEGSPRVVVEALACGTPVVTTDVGDVPQMVDSETPITVVQSRDPMSLADALTKFAGYRKKPCPKFVQAHSSRRVFQRVLDVLAEAARKG